MNKFIYKNILLIGATMLIIVAVFVKINIPNEIHWSIKYPIGLVLCYVFLFLLPDLVRGYYKRKGFK